MRKALFILLLPLAGCYASASVGIGGAGVLLHTMGSLLQPNNVEVTFIDNCVDSALIISSGEKLGDIWIHRGQPFTRRMYAGGTNPSVEVTLLGFSGGRQVGVAEETFYWSQEDNAFWYIGNPPQRSNYRHQDIITSPRGQNMCR